MAFTSLSQKVPVIDGISLQSRSPDSSPDSRMPNTPASPVMPNANHGWTT